jgi:hypothetical protein
MARRRCAITVQSRYSAAKRATPRARHEEATTMGNRDKQRKEPKKPKQPKKPGA